MRIFFTSGDAPDVSFYIGVTRTTLDIRIAQHNPVTLVATPQRAGRNAGILAGFDRSPTP